MVKREYEFSTEAGRVLREMETIAGKMGHLYIGTEHLLLAILVHDRCAAAALLMKHHVTGERVFKALEKMVPAIPNDGSKQKRIPRRSPRLERLIESAAMEAQRLDVAEVGTIHFLFGMLRDRECIATRALLLCDVSLKALFEDMMQLSGVDPSVYRDDQKDGGKYSGALEHFGTDLTMKARDGALEPVAGRDDVLRRMMQILGRKTKNNPCLVGEPGVGKTAIAEGVAICIAQGRAPEFLQNKKVYSVDLAAMLAGSRYRGDFEEKMKALIDEVEELGDVILFLDELHTVIGAGGAEGTIDASSMLKPALARGAIQVIGATTTAEYRKHVEKDAALERRFQPVHVAEPSAEEAEVMLESVARRLEAYHGLTIGADMIREAIALSKRYIPRRCLPDKAIDVLDEACVYAAMRTGADLGVFDEDIEKISELKRAKEAAVLADDLEEAAKLQIRQRKAQRKLDRARKRNCTQAGKEERQLTKEDIAHVVSLWTKIPVQQVAKTEAVRLLNLEEELHRRVIGQEEAVGAVARAIKRGRVGLKDAGRPVGSFLFLGPTGVGKTELAKALTEAMFGTEDALIRIDMSEYMEMHSAAKLIGSPPGYVGYGDGGQLSEQVRANPYSVVLFDEVEKAHPDVFNLLLQVLDDGHLTDSQGRKVDFANTVIIMTSNVGAKAIVEPKRLGFATAEHADADYKRMKQNVMNEVRLLFRPEFLNRLDEMIVFHMLTDDELLQIVSLLADELSGRMLEQTGITLVFRRPAKELIAKQGADAKYGARPLRRALQSKVEDVLTDRILTGEIKRGDKVMIGVSGGQLSVQRKS